MKTLLEQVQEAAHLADAAQWGPWYRNTGLEAVDVEDRDGQLISSFALGQKSGYQNACFVEAARNLNWPALAAALSPTTEEPSQTAKVWVLFNEDKEAIGVYASREAAHDYIETDRSYHAWPSPAECYQITEFDVEPLSSPAPAVSATTGEGQSEAEQLVQRLADWSRRYPRGTVYGSSGQAGMDGQLIEMEEAAKKLCPATPIAPSHA